MMDTLVGIGIFAFFIVGIWFSYRLFMRGDTYEEKVARLLPSDYKPDVFHRQGDTYVGYEKASGKLAVIDWPHGKILPAKQIVSLEAVQESTLGLTHHWVAVRVADASFPVYRIWFQFRRAKRDEWLARLAQICGKEAPVRAS
jgi:hypothetical protein